ncbi:MAG: phenylalanine--tRNA ligase subunit alpha, partial [Thermoplasmata archaeon]
YIEYALWDMDSLFIAQDHPARDLQDTFYVSTSNMPEVENPEIEDSIKRIHERGSGKYSGWGYRWSHDKAMELVLRTHTTVNTARYLYKSAPPKAIFSVEKVFRHESVDWKHLAEFHQIEGAVYSRDANVSTLKWMLRNFYSRIGFDEIKLIPSYYPYTEPSIDVIVNIDGKEVELGGSGILRPEVGRILGLKAPVIAWGLGLERLAMMYYDLTDIRQLYNSDFDWLQTYRIH